MRTRGRHHRRRRGYLGAVLIIIVLAVAGAEYAAGHRAVVVPVSCRFVPSEGINGTVCAPGPGSPGVLP